MMRFAQCGPSFSAKSAELALLWAAIAGLLALTAAIMVLFQRITREIESLKDL